ncbi:Ribonuclease/ribotoxin [Pleurotus eryngii]|uniref:Ribonuclease/ribotoxin n=1 Tax=Pleurotus eryngii TaxID=5323 RepID=A0A9P5ZQB7_PLEER|nr:Ribonuclease/ribotoxin [Pleurotus eryngii]
MQLNFQGTILLSLLAVLFTFVHGATLNIDATRDCDCKVVIDGKKVGNTYTSGEVDTALKRGKDLEKKGQTLGGNDYPHTFGNREDLVFPNSCKGELSEFVILKKGGASRDPETDRVVWDSKGRFCGCMTHNGVAGNNFQVCK